MIKTINKILDCQDTPVIVAGLCYALGFATAMIICFN